MSTNQPNTETDRDSPDPLVEWQDEATAIIRDVQKHVKDIQISTKLQSSKTNVFLNATTLENKTFCIQISCEGFQIVGHSYDTIDANAKPSMTYETPYALLNDISPGYVQSFGNELANELEKLTKDSLKRD